MPAPTFEDIARLPVTRFYEDAFRKATGVPLKVAPPDEPLKRRSLGADENEFCALAAGTPAGCAGCLETQVRAQRGVARGKAPQQINCFAGLTDVSVPIIIHGRHVATLMSGQVFRREPTQRDFDMIVKLLQPEGDDALRLRLRASYFRTPVVNAERFEALIQLLTVFARYLGDFAERQAVALSETDPPAVAGAKRFVQEHAGEPISLSQVVAHVGVSRFHFCRLFKKATGMTLTDYVTQVRLEKAKALLADHSLRISEVVYSSGFGSIPRFNSAFKQHLGISPSAYRETLRSPSPA